MKKCSELLTRPCAFSNLMYFKVGDDCESMSVKLLGDANNFPQVRIVRTQSLRLDQKIQISPLAAEFVMHDF